MTHTNVFTEEDAFLDHYARARHIARHPLNHVRTCDGADILGTPMVDENDRVLEHEGRPRWRHVPLSGFVPAIDAWEDKHPAPGAAQLHHVNTRLYAPPPGTPWVEVSGIATHLQSTLLVGTLGQAPRLSCRVTPEVRLELDPDTGVRHLVRTMSFEWRMFGWVDITNAMVNDMLDQQPPILRMWYPLATGVARTATSAKTTTPDNVRVTNLLIRLRALHDVGSLVTP